MCRSLSGVRAILRLVSHTWGRPVSEADAGWVVVDVETSGFHPRNARVLSVAALALDAQGNVTFIVDGATTLEFYLAVCEQEGLPRPNVLVD